MCKPLVSVVIPVYNGSNYLKEAVDSVLNQTYSNVEIIVVNDGSDDDGKTEKIALAYGDQIQYIRKENGGVATALNKGIEQMRGEYFSWLSHDDLFYPEKIEKQMKLLRQEGANITACSYHIFYDSGRRIEVPILDFYGRKFVENRVFSVIHAMIQFGGVLFHRKIFEIYGMFREDLRTTQDYEFLFRVLRREKCIYSNELLYGIRYHELQGSHTISSVDIERDEMYGMFLNTLTSDEKCGMYGSAYCFYYQMLLRIWPLEHMDRALRLCMDGLNQSFDNGWESEKQDTEQILNGPVLIYGAGAYGRRLLFDLRCRGIAVAGFVDGNRALRGQKIDGVLCYSLPDVLDRSIRGNIVIASLFRQEIAESLRKNGIKSFWFKEDYDRKVMRTAPVPENIWKVMADYETRKSDL